MKKYFLMIIAAFSIAALLPAAGCAEYAAEKNANLVTNGSFEEGTKGWSIGKNSAQTVEDVFHEGTHSLYYQNTDRNAYRLFTQNLDVKPGQFLAFSVWVKGKDLKGAGAGIFMQSQDAQKKHINSSQWGGFPLTLHGDFGWTKISGEYQVPDNAAYTQVGLYLRRGSTGEAWFDDVIIRDSRRLDIASTLQYPNYRGYILENDTAPWQLKADVLARDNAVTGEVTLKTSLKDANGNILQTQENTLSLPREESTFVFKKPSPLAVGDYSLEQIITNPDGKISRTETFPIHIVKKMPGVYIDKQGFTVVDGKRFFPLGIYTGPTFSPRGKDNYANNATATDLQRMHDAGLNTVLSYGYAASPVPKAAAQEYMELARRNGLHVIYSVKDMYNGHGGYPRQGLTGTQAAEAQIQAVKDSPALLAWYINDEMGMEWQKEIRARYDQIGKLGSDRPAYIASNAPRADKYFINAMDVLGTDPYPVTMTSDGNLSMVTDWTRMTAQTAGNKGIWQVLQVHNSSFPKSKDAQSPTLEQMRNMSYQAMINGTKGLIYFAYHWLFVTADDNGKPLYSQEVFDKRWPDVQKLIAEVKPLTDVILADHKIDLKVLSPSTAQYQAWEYNGKLYIMVANAATPDKPTSLQLQIPKGWRLANKISGINAKMQGQTLQLELSPIASGTIVLGK